MRGASFVAFLVAVSLAGCLTPTSVDLPSPSDLVQLLPIPDFPIEQDHDHKDALLHVGSANLASVAFDSGYGMGTARDIPAGEGFSELFVRDHLLFLGRRAADDAGDLAKGVRGGANGGFLVYDIKDPAHPKKLSEWQGLAAYDMESTTDNHYVFFVSQYLNNQQPASVPPDQPGEIPRGVHVIDIRDPAKPMQVSFFPVPTRGGHTLTYYRTDAGRELVVVQTYDFIPDPSLNPPGQVPDYGINNAAQRVLIFDFLRMPQPRLQLLSTYERHDLPPGVLSSTVSYNPHDSSIQKHPKTGQLILYVAYWDLGAILLSIDDPARPKEISLLKDFSPSKLAKAHLVRPGPDLIDGRHITITEPELGGATPETGQYTIFDTTDPVHPTRLGYWTLPGELQNTSNYTFSPHNFVIDHGRLYLAHYHAGVWVVDIHDHERLLQPRAVAYAQPHEARADYSKVPDVWGVEYHDGYVYASDMGTGLHVYQFAGDEPGKRLV